MAQRWAEGGGGLGMVVEGGGWRGHVQGAEGGGCGCGNRGR